MRSVGISLPEAIRETGKGGLAATTTGQKIAQELQHEIDKFKDVPKPAIILIPGREGPLGLGQTALKAAVERAVGSDIL